MAMRAITIAAAVLLLCGCPTLDTHPLAQPERIPVEGPYVHRPSGITLPESMGGFPRISVLRYDAEGLDISAGYNYASLLHPMIATVYVYPSPGLVSIGSSAQMVAGTQAVLTESEFKRRIQEVLQAHPRARLVEQRDTTRTENGQSYPGKLAVFEFEDMFGGSKIPLRSHLYLFCYIGDKWTVAYRFTHPQAVGNSEEIEEFIQDFRWATTGI